MFLEELGIAFERPVLHVDNMATIHMIKNADTGKRTRYFDIKYHGVKELYKAGKFELAFVPTTEQLADFLTKQFFQLGSPQLKKLLELCRVVNRNRS